MVEKWHRPVLGRIVLPGLNDKGNDEFSLPFQKKSGFAILHLPPGNITFRRGDPCTARLVECLPLRRTMYIDTFHRYEHEV
jgi:hypothetical protein